MDIRHAAAINAADMLMRFDITVETCLPPAPLQLLDKTRLNKLIEIAIDGPQADAGHPLTDDVEEVRGGGMGVEPAEFLDDEVPLARVSLWA